MLQIIQYQKTGKLSVEELPSPQLQDGAILVRNVASVISAGTERTSVETAQASLLGKAKLRPDLVQQVLKSAKRDGVVATYKKVQNRLDNYKELGYSSAGIVIASSVDTFKPGERVACAGQAYHAEEIAIPKHLATKIPDSISFEEAAFATICSIALQGVRQANVRLGETVTVIGLGLIGLITVQLLKANGCRVIGLDVTKANFDLAIKLGCDTCLLSSDAAVGLIESQTRGYGADASIITASTQSDEPVSLACQFARKKSRIVVVGAVGMHVPRSPFYEKELELAIACSYGPGRYDQNYEMQGVDYPIGYVRWTENRNMEAVLDLMAQGRLDVKPLITHRFPINDALKAYDLVTAKAKGRFVGIVIEYPSLAKDEERTRRIQIKPSTGALSALKETVVGFVGAGNFAQSHLLPHLMRPGIRLKGVVTAKPVNAKSVARKFGFELCTTDPAEILDDPEINTVIIATRHDTHAALVTAGLERKKHVFVEKPLAITREQLDGVAKCIIDTSACALLTGFNRRFSKPLREVRTFFSEVSEPLIITYRVNAGALPDTHWVYDPHQGGRVIGEVCHFIDSLSFLAGAKLKRIQARGLETKIRRELSESVSVDLTFDNGSLASIIYVASGSPALPKEYCEVHGGGRSAVMDDFETVEFLSGAKSSTSRYDGSKGHKEEMAHFLKLVSGVEPPEISFQSMHDTSLATILIHESIRSGGPVEL
jgi:polar amino acid transport system substrate-binding protein